MGCTLCLCAICAQVDFIPFGAVVSTQSTWGALCVCVPYVHKWTSYPLVQWYQRRVHGVHFVSVCHMCTSGLHTLWCSGMNAEYMGCTLCLCAICAQVDFIPFGAVV